MNVFIAGARTIKKLDNEVLVRLNNIFKQNYTVLVGDAGGVDSEVQKYFYNQCYKDVLVFASNGKARNNIGNWEIKNVMVDDTVKGFDFFASKDEKMAESADYGFMIWNGESKGTLNNIINLLNMNKLVLLYYNNNKKFYKLKTLEDLYSFIRCNVTLNNKLTKILPDYNDNYVQISM